MTRAPWSEEPIQHTVVHNAIGYSEASFFLHRRLMVQTMSIDCCDERVICRTVILRTTHSGTLHPWQTMRDLVLWEQHYPAEHSTLGGLREAHAHVVARVQAGDLP